MKKTVSLLCAILAASFYTGSALASCTDGTGCLQVPGDFSQPVNNFSMYLLGGWFNLDMNDGSGKWIGINDGYSAGVTSLNTTGNQINFTATQFDHNGPGQGTSILETNLNHVVLGSAYFFGNLATIYANGSATGTLVDTVGSTAGHWRIDTHLFANWNGLDLDLGVIPISTNASYSYNIGAYCDFDLGNCVAQHNATATGNIMDYHSGLAYMVGQGIMYEGPFQGLRVTIGLQGQDPLATPAAVPVPGAVWLLGSGLAGLASFARKRKTV